MLIAGSASASAAPRWVDLGVLSAAGQSVLHQHVGVDQAGNATVVWERSNGTNTIVQEATRSAGAVAAAGTLIGSFSAPVDLSAAGQNANDPQVAVDPAGDAVVVWERSNGSNTIVQAATRTAGGSFSTPVDLSASGQNALAPQVALDQAGDIVVVWERSNGTNKIVQEATRTFGRPFSSPVDLSAPGQDAVEPQVAVDHTGDAVVVWERSNGSNTIIQGTSRPDHGSFSTPVDLSAAGQNAGDPKVAMDAVGDTTVVWDRSDGSNSIVQELTRPRSGSNSIPVSLSEPGQNAGSPEVAVNPAGDQVIVWVRFDGSNPIVQGTGRPAGGTFTAAADLSTAGQTATTPQVAIDPGGDSIALWDHDNTVAFANRSAGRSFSAQADITNGGFPQVAMDQAGDAVGVWGNSDGSNLLVDAAGFDFAGPQLRGLAIPTSGAVGVPVSFVVSPLDVFTGSATGWIFGDGKTASGDTTRVSHTYKSPGKFEVTVSSTDFVGNTSTASGAITIAPAALSGFHISPATFSLAGRRANGHCVKPNGTNRSHKRCRRTIRLNVSYTLSSPSAVTLKLSPVAASLTESGKAGANSFVLIGKVDGHPLAPGSYQVTATPVGGASQTTTFKVVP